MSIEARLAALGHTLPPLPQPAFDYVPAVRDGDLVWVSGQLPRDGAGGLPVLGRLGAEVDVDGGRRAAELCALQGLAALLSVAGSLEAVRRVVKLAGFVASATGFVERSARDRRRVQTCWPNRAHGDAGEACPQRRGAWRCCRGTSRWSRSSSLFALRPSA